MRNHCTRNPCTPRNRHRLESGPFQEGRHLVAEFMIPGLQGHGVHYITIFHAWSVRGLFFLSVLSIKSAVLNYEASFARATFVGVSLKGFTKNSLSGLGPHPKLQKTISTASILNPIRLKPQPLACVDFAGFGAASGG